VEETKIIIKKVKKVHGGGGHGGSAWKVAYADFVTAMMAFFLLLWLLSMVAPEKRAAVSQYFQHFSIFEKSGTSFMEKGATIVSEKMFKEMLDPKKTISPLNPGKHQTLSREEVLREKLKKDVEKKLSDVKNQVMVETFGGGVKIELIDQGGSPMFPLGNSQLTPKAKEIIKVIAANVNSSVGTVAIEGHTDALSYSTNRYTNWELSTERASAARKALEDAGLNPDRIIRVSGHAATAPLIKENPLDPRNRRISIMLYTPPAEPAPEAAPEEASAEPAVAGTTPFEEPSAADTILSLPMPGSLIPKEEPGPRLTRSVLPEVPAPAKAK
jgi:chemotaxis protein MotB